MHLPADVSSAIERLIAGRESEVLRAAEEITAAYRGERKAGSQLLRSDSHRLAYLVVRLPATYAAISSALNELRARSTVEITSILDLGAGPGTATLAVRTLFPELTSTTLVERDSQWRPLASELLEAAGIGQTNWREDDIANAQSWPQHDLVCLGYSLGELTVAAQQKLVAAAWRSATKALVVIEPGSVAGYDAVLGARDWLLAQGAHLVAPCPHSGTCSLLGTKDWCHFAARVERTSLHRRAKGAALPYEDEKFSYFIAAREPVTPAAARIVRRPEPGKGHLRLLLCTPDGMKSETISKKHGDLYRAARRAEWGDAWPPGETGGPAPE